MLRATNASWGYGAGRWRARSSTGSTFATPPSWLEIGCGTGALTAAICERTYPASVLACDTAVELVAHCRAHLEHPRIAVELVAPGTMPSRPGGFDAVVSSLVLNFLPDPDAALAQMRETCARGGSVGAAVWDYADGMEFLDLFWDAARRPSCAGWGWGACSRSVRIRLCASIR